MTIAEALRETAQRLAATSDTARLDAELLMAHALGISRSELLLRRMGDAPPANFAPLAARRARHEPIAYIIGEQEFYGRTFAIVPGVLIPRADSETVISAALAACPGACRVLDCGVGSGALLVTFLAERPGSSGTGIDRDALALDIAGENALRNARSSDWQMLLRDWHEPGWSRGLGPFDLILANPPYVETAAELAPSVRDFEPAGALFAGADGLDDYHVLIPQLAALLAPNGVAVLEIGAAQAGSVSTLAEAAGFTTKIRNDLGNRSRAAVLAIRGWQRPGE